MLTGKARAADIAARRAARFQAIRERDAAIEHLHAASWSYDDIAQAVGLSKTRVWNRCRELGLPRRPRGRPKVP